MTPDLPHGKPIPPLAAPDVSLGHLQAELARIDVLIQREVRRWQLAGQDPTDAFRGLHISDADAARLVRRPFGQSWGQTMALEADEAHQFAAAQAEAMRKVQSIVEAVHRREQITHLEFLAMAFDLDRFDLDTLLICLAPAFDLRYERLYGYLQDDVTRKQPQVSLILDLLSEPAQVDRLSLVRHFDQDAPLFRHCLVERVVESEAGRPPLLGQVLNVDETIVFWLLGHYRPHPELGPYVTLANAHPSQTDALLTAEVRQDLAAVASRAGHRPPVVALHGDDRSAQQAIARVLSAQVGQPLLTADLAAAVAAEMSPQRALYLVLRDALLIRAIPFLVGWDACLVDGAPPHDLLAALFGHPGLVIVSGQEHWQATGIERDRLLFWQECQTPAFSKRKALWQHFLADSATLSEPDLSLLAGQFELTSDQIRDVVSAAQDAVAARDMVAQGSSGQPEEPHPHGNQTGSVQSHDLFVAARARSSPRLGHLTRKIEPRYGWSDIILPEDQLTLLHEIVQTVRGRPLVLEEWGVGQKLVASTGVTMLFAGPPGTGKTMAAEVIAAELRLDLYKIDLSTVVSKYIGETEKNLEQIFNEAENSNAILFFDEADAIFGKRSEVKDAHDRYANIEISYLLQRMEAYDGVTILATNLRSNLDEAFTRRLQFAVDFPFPEEEYRLRIWQTLFPSNIPRAPDVDLGVLARRFRLAGGNIRNIIVGAAYLAAADEGMVAMKHMLHSTRRELQKMGRLVKESDLIV